MVNQAKKTAKKVKFSGKEAVTVQSEISCFMGDEAGTNMGKVLFKQGSSKVKAQGKKCIHLTSMTGHNGSNANMPAGVQVAPSQTKVIIAP